MIERIDQNLFSNVEFFDFVKKKKKKQTNKNKQTNKQTSDDWVYLWLVIRKR